jgi:hypothetical protein
MKKLNRAHRAVQLLQQAPNKTLTLYELEKLMGTNWSPRAISEARQLDGVVIKGHNPYTLVSSGIATPKKPIRYEIVTDAQGYQWSKPVYL